MKKKLSLLMVALMAIAAFAGLRRASTQTEFDFDANALDMFGFTTASTGTTHDADFTETKSYVKDGVTIAVSPSTTSTPNRIWGSSPALRMYGGTLTITAPTGKFVTNIAISQGKWNDGNTADSGDLTSTEWKGSANAVVLTIAGNTQFKKITVTVSDEAAATTVATPTISGTPPFYGSYEVTLACETEGAAIHYTTDGADPTEASTLYKDPFTLTESATVKAIAIKGAEVSSIASKNFVINPIVATVSALNALTSGSFKMNGEMLVVAQPTTKHTYVTDATGATLIYGEGKVPAEAVGKTIAAPWNGSVSIYKGLFEAIPDAAVTLKDGDAVPVTYPVATAADITADNVNKVVLLKAVTYTALDGKNFTITENEPAIAGYNQFGLEIAAPEEGKVYNIVGAIGRYNDNIQFQPISITEAVLYNVAIADGITGGTVTANVNKAQAGDEVTLTITPAEGYKLSSLSVTGVTSNEAVEVKDGKFTMPADGVTVNAVFVQPEDIIIAPETGADISAALAEACVGKIAKDITINLAAGGAYTVSASLVAPNSITINGAAGAKIDASALTTPFVQMDAIAADATLNEKGAYVIDGITIKDVTITGLPYQLIYGNKQKYLMNKILVENSIIGINGTAKKTIFDFNGGGNASEIIIDKSTIYANPSNEQNGGLFSSQSGHGSIQDLGSDKQLFAITNSTIYNIAYGKTINSQRRNNTAGMEFQVENSIIVNSGKSGQFIVGLNGGSANSAQTYTVNGNVFNYDDADVSAAEQAKVQEKIADKELNSYAGVVKFTNAAEGDFNGVFVVDAITLDVSFGDPRWTVTQKVEPVDVAVAAEDITEGDITAAIAAKAAGKPVNNLVITLAASTAYKVTASMEVSGNVTITGAEGAVIDASALTTPFIQMDAIAADATLNEKGAYVIDGITIKDVTITGLPYQLIYGNKQKYLMNKILVENSIIGINGTAKKTIFDFNGGGNASEIIIDKSTIYANPSNEQNGGLFSSQSGHGSIQDLGSDKQLFAITNSTIYNIAYGKTINSQRRNNTAGMEFQVENSIIVNSGKSGQFIVGLNGGSANSAQTYTVNGNVFNYDDADVSAAEQAKVQEKIAEFTTTSINGVVAFTDAANGDFNATLGTELALATEKTEVGDPRWTVTNVQIPSDIEISPAEGDIAAALATACEGKLVKNITINLTENVTYTVGATLIAPNSITINGNGAIIDASALEGNMIEFAAKAAEDTEWTNADVAITAVTVKGLKKALFYSNSKYYYGNFSLINSVVEQAADAITFDYTKGSVALNFTIAGSTIYAPTATTKSLYSSQSAQRAIDYNADATQNFLFSLNTMYNLAKGKNFFTHRQNSQKWISYTVQNNLFVNCGKSGQVIKGLNGGGSSANPTWVVKGNAFNFDGADTSANEETGDAEEPVQESVAGVMTFTNVETPDFGGTFEMPFGATAPEALGDNRWTITYTNALEKLYIIGLNGNWDRTNMIEMTRNESGRYEYEFTTETQAFFAFADKQMTAEEAGADSDWSVFNSFRYSLGDGNVEYTQLGEIKSLVKGAANGTIILKPGTFKITVEPDFNAVTITGEFAPEPQPVTVDKLFIMGTGTPKGWEGTTELTFNEATQAFEYVATVTEDTYLTFGDAEFTSWDDFKGKHRFAPAEGNTDAVLDQAIQLVLVSDGNVVLKNAGTYKISVTKDLKMTITATGTGINSIAADKMKDATIYTISGQRVEKAQKGLYIINGKKVVIK